MTERENSDRIDDLQVTADGNHDKIAALTEAAEELVLNINALNRETGGTLVSLSLRAKRNRRIIWALAVSLFLDVTLTIFMVNLAYKVDEAQQLTRNQVLCPLYQQFVNSDTPAARERARVARQNLEARDEAFRVIRKSYDALECADKR
jgi:hypothetical protein